MMIADLRSHVAQFLSSNGLRLDKRLGQNFLVNQDVLDAIVEAAKLTKADSVVEIGPGIGVLTRELLTLAGSVTAIELDARLPILLKKYCADVESPGLLKVIQGNALSTPFPTTPYKIVANIPYHITSPLLRHAFLESPVPPTSLTLLIQREVAEKIVDTEHAGLLTILVAIFGKPSLVRTVPPDCFIPPPAVHSAVLHIESHDKPLVEREMTDRVLRLVKIGFSQKRKMLRNTLGQMPNGAELLDALAINPMRRPETLDIQEWIALARHPFSQGTEPENPQEEEEKS